MEINDAWRLKALKIPEKYSREIMMSMESEVLRAMIRERAHHTVEWIVYLTLEIRIEIHPNHGALRKHFLDI